MSRTKRFRFLSTVCIMIFAAVGLAQAPQEKPAAPPPKQTESADQAKTAAQQPSTPATKEAAPTAKESGTEAPAKDGTASDAAVEAASTPLAPGSKVFIAPMPIDFHRFLTEAIRKKKVPLQVVEDRNQAEFEITGTAESQKAGAAKIIIMGSWHSRESASIKVTNLKSGIVVYAYSYNTSNSSHGPRSSAESCAKHLKNKIEGKE
ncbi:MAG: hypothetical protein ACRD3A_02055 [Terriglobales bacterium]